MKICLVVLAKHQYFDRERGYTHEYQCFYPALEHVFDQIVLVDTTKYMASRQFYELNESILGEVELFPPEAEKYSFFVQLDNEVFPDTLQRLSKASVKTIHWATDDSYKFFSFSKYICVNYSLNLTTERLVIPFYKALGASVEKVNWSYDERAVTPVKTAKTCTHDVCFIGLNYFDRERYVSFLNENGVNVFVKGYGWPDGSVKDISDISKLFNDSKVVLNFSRSKQGSQTKARVFEVMASGSCLVTEWSPDLEDYFQDGVHCKVFKTPQECVSIVKRLISEESDRESERDRIAIAGQFRCVDNYSYRHQFLRIFDMATKTCLDRKLDQSPCVVIIFLLKSLRMIVCSRYLPRFISKGYRLCERKLAPRWYFSRYSASFK